MVGETLIVGGGLAGGAAALLLARGGLSVTLFEREAGAHDKVCGEFLSVEAQQILGRLGLDPMTLGAVPIDRVRLVAHGREAEARLPFRALGLSRRVLDAALLDHAGQAGAQIERGVRVNAIDGDRVQTASGDHAAERILVATGKHGLRGSGAPRDSGYVGFKTHWRLSRLQAAQLAGWIELLPFEGGYAGLQMVAADTANLCLIVRRETLGKSGGGWDALLTGLLRDDAFAARLEGAEPLFQRALSIANLPYGHIRRHSPDGLFQLGDRAAMTASLTGDGMAGALLSAKMAAECILSGGTAEAYQRRFADAVQPQIRRAMWLQRLTELPFALRIGMAALRLRPCLLETLAGSTRLPGWRNEGSRAWA
jgi:flavin-dependent dehydrogenase